MSYAPVVTIGDQKGTLTRQYQIDDLVDSVSRVHAGMTVAVAQSVLDVVATPHTGLAKRLFAFAADGRLVEDEMVRACRVHRSDASILVWVGLLLADSRLAAALEDDLTDGTGRLDPERFNAAALTQALDQKGVGGNPQKVASNILRYLETAGLARARRHGATVVGIDRFFPPVDAVPAVLTLLHERLSYIDEEVAVASGDVLEFAIERGVNHWLGLSDDDFRLAASGGVVRPAPEPGEVIDGSDEGLDGFKPKDDSDYIVTVEARTIVKSRRHETLVNDYAEWVENRGYEAVSEHPVDLMLSRDGSRWLIEAKVLYKANATDAVRAAIGQVFTYRYMLYRDSDPSLVGLFSESIGDGYVELLESLGIIAVWRQGDGWGGSASAVDLGLVEAL